MTPINAWNYLADAVLTHDLARERDAWRELLCTTCRRETVIPGEHLCAECLIAAAHRRADQERPDGLNIHRGAA